MKKSENFEKKSKAVNARLLRRKTRKSPQTPEGRQSWPNCYERRLENPPAGLWGQQSRSNCYKKDKKALRAVRRNVFDFVWIFLIFYFFLNFCENSKFFKLNFCDHFKGFFILKYFKFFSNFEIFRKFSDFLKFFEHFWIFDIF